jgi:phosphate/sulfate permease
LALPLCERCHRAIGARQRLGSLIGALVGLAAGFLWGLPVAISLLIVGAILGFLWSRRLPVRLRRYSPSRGVVSVSFAHPLIALQTLEPLRHRFPETGTA